MAGEAPAELFSLQRTLPTASVSVPPQVGGQTHSGGSDAEQQQEINQWVNLTTLFPAAGFHLQEVLQQANLWQQKVTRKQAGEGGALRVLERP